MAGAERLPKLKLRPCKAMMGLVAEGQDVMDRRMRRAS